MKIVQKDRKKHNKIRNRKKHNKIINRLRTNKFIDNLNKRFNWIECLFLLLEYLTEAAYNPSSSTFGWKILKASNMKEVFQQFKAYMQETDQTVKKITTT